METSLSRNQIISTLIETSLLTLKKIIFRRAALPSIDICASVPCVKPYNNSVN